METTYRMTEASEQLWGLKGRPGARERKIIRSEAKAIAKARKASVVTIETPAGVIVDTLEVA